ncbi:ParA family protein [Bacillus toyonensis]|uniref:Chromosome partitioning protein ParA n=1 Tax=Bacillus toyonensis TaxID=155322 RepID=A0A2A8GVK3_9BACI|nr:ParA family protein [Bacillus toyonensis]PEP80926.1 chromosome partitioning protein ParA [Bacillus toyonensis]
MTYKLAFVQNKGGVLKSSMTVNIAGLYAKQGKRVLIVDADQQGNSLLSFGKNPDKYRMTLHDVLVNFAPVREAIVNVYKNIDILPSNEIMSFLDFDILPNLDKYINPFLLLKVALMSVEDEYDVILFDSPPSSGLIQSNVICCTDRIIIPFQPEQYSVRSLIKIIDVINQFKQKHNPNLDIAGVVATLVQKNTKLHAEAIKQARQFCEKESVHFFNANIPRSISFANSIAYNKLPLTLAKKDIEFAFYYKSLFKELNEHEQPQYS